jgi:hypothetical protein
MAESCFRTEVLAFLRRLQQLILEIPFHELRESCGR